jgi:hypothetical protein
MVADWLTRLRSSPNRQFPLDRGDKKVNAFYELFNTAPYLQPLDGDITKICKDLILVSACKIWCVTCIVSPQPPRTANSDKEKTYGSQETDQEIETIQEVAQRQGTDKILEVKDSLILAEPACWRLAILVGQTLREGLERLVSSGRWPFAAFGGFVQ